jgi:hypothetical protein
MGGILMFKTIGMLIVIFICGFLLIEWISITHPFLLSESLITFVMNPLKFFTAAVVLVIGVVCNGNFIREMIHKWRTTERIKKQWRGQRIFEPAGFLFIHFLLFQMGWEQTIVFFSFSVMYGMISLKLQ